MVLLTREKKIEDLFTNEFHSLVFTSFRIVNDFEESKDIVQNVFVKIWQNIESINHIADLNHYVKRAVRNSSLNYIRDNKLKDHNKVSADSVHLVARDDDDELQSGERINKIHQAVDKLPENWRKAFVLSKYEKLKYYEIAEKMNISNKTVEKYISKALLFIRQEMKSILLFLIYFFR